MGVSLRMPVSGSIVSNSRVHKYKLTVNGFDLEPAFSFVRLKVLFHNYNKTIGDTIAKGAGCFIG